MRSYPGLLAFVLVFVICSNPNTAHAQISGHLTVCRGASRTTLTGTPGGGVWSSGDVTRATINSSTGEVTGIAAGTATITYVDPTTAVHTAVVTVNNYMMTPIGFSMGSDTRCTGGVPASCTVSPMNGNNWTSSDPTIATVNTGGLVVPSATNSGTVTISYRHGYGNCYVTRDVSVNPTPTVSVTNPACVGVTQTATGTPAGGTWSSSNASVGTIHSTTGVLSSFTGGSTYIRYTAGGCLSQTQLTVTAAPAAITGATTICVGNTSTLSSSTSGGTWSSSDPSVATIGSSSGLVTGVSNGTTTISYLVGSSCYRTVIVTVNAAPTASTGPDEVCVGQAIMLTNSTGGGSWSSSNTSRATVTTYGGTVAGVSAGTVNISYRVGGGCPAIKTVTVNATMSSITGGPNVCQGASVILAHSMGGGTWAASNANATVDMSSGEMTGVTAGSVNITYTAGPGCVKVQMMIIKSAPAAITGTANICAGVTTTFSSATGGGTWSSNNTSVASIGTGSGIATGISGGTAVISYVASGTGCYTTRVMTVDMPPIGGALDMCTGLVYTLTPPSSGGTWVSSNSAIASIGSGSGVVAALGSDTSTITYLIGGGCLTKAIVTVSPMPGAISGSDAVFVGGSATLSNGTAGGVWSSSNSAVASVSPSTGELAGVSGGTAVVTYAISGACFATLTVTVAPLSTRKITTLLGTGVAGSTGDGGAMNLARLNNPGYFVIAPSGDIYITEATGNRVRKISTAGVVSTVAGTGSAGSTGDGGPATAAKLNGPSGLALDSDGNLYIAENSGSRVRKVSTSGIITRFAGTGSAATGGDGGAATAAAINRPHGLAFDGSGNLYVVEQYGHRVRKIAAGTNVITTIAGTGYTGSTGDGGPATAATLKFPNCILVDGSDIYITDNGNQRVRKINSSGIITAFAGIDTLGFSGDGGPATAAKLNFPAAMRKDASGNFYLADHMNHRIRKITPSGIISTVVGTGDAGFNGDCIDPEDAWLHRPHDVSFDAAGNMIIADAYNHRLRKITDSISLYGNGTMCSGSGLTYSSSAAGGSWSSSNPAVATIDSVSGYIVAVATGTTTITYALDGGCTTEAVLTVNTTIPAIDGTTYLYIGDTTTLSDSVSGGTWSSSNTGVATIDATTGLLTAISIGTTTISYVTEAGCYVTTTVTVNGCVISGTLSVCITGSTTLTSTVSGGTWVSSATSVATIGSSSGVVAPVTAGTTTISYIASGCTGIAVVTVNSVLPAISGTTSVCTGSVTVLSIAATGGTWSSDNTSVATVDIIGAVYGANPGTATISYTRGGCISATVVTVNLAPDPITGTAYADVGTTTTLSNSAAGGTWSSSNIAIATVDPSSGEVTGVAVGTVIISYELAGGCYDTKMVTITSPGATKITTLVGTGADGSAGDGGPLNLAELNNPGYFIIAPSGDIYVTEAWGNRVRKITPSGVITTVAGTGSASSTGDGGPATAATLEGPSGLALDSDGNLYIAENTGSRIRRVSTSGIITTFAGTGYMSTGGDGGPATDAQIDRPHGLAFDADGNLIVVEQYAHRIRKIAAGTNIITTIAGTGAEGSTGDGGPATDATFFYPNCILVDGSDIYITDNGNHRVRKIDGSGIITAFAGIDTLGFSGDGGPATAARLNFPAAMRKDTAGNFYLADHMNHRIRKITPSGIISTVVGTGDDGYNGDCIAPEVAWLNRPHDVAFDAAGDMIIADALNHRLRKITNSISIYGTSPICSGSAITYGSSASGGSWSSSNTSVAIVGSVSGEIIGLSTGTTTISYSIGGGCSASAALTVNAAVSDIYGITSLFAGDSTILSDSASGGVWSSSDNAVATINSSTGLLVALGVGTTTVSYVTGAGCYATTIVTVNAGCGITGSLSVCLGNSVTLGSATSGGTWTSSATSVATVDSASGIVVAVSTGTAVISYVSGSCTSSVVVTVNSALSGITGATTICPGSTIALSNSVSGGLWSSDNTTIAIVEPDGVVTGITSGTATIVYTVGGCSTSVVVTVSAPVSAGILSGPSAVAVAGTITLSSTVSGGTWSSSDMAMATVGSSTGVVTGVSSGWVSITYTKTGLCGLAIATRAVNVTGARPSVPGDPGDNVIVFRAYPNPSFGILSVETSLTGSMVLSTIDGRELAQYGIRGGITQLQIPAGVVAGVYMLCFKADNGSVKTLRLIYRP